MATKAPAHLPSAGSGITTDPRLTLGGRLPTGWPLAALLVLYPLWWLLGISSVALVLAAAVMVWQLRAVRPLRLPPGFALWALFLVVVLVSSVMLNADAPGVTTSSGVGRYFAYALRLLNYVAAGVILVYVGNLRTQILPSVRVIRWMGVLFLSTVVGGFLALAFPNAAIQTPFGLILPGSIGDAALGSNLTASFAQVQSIIGSELPRPSAPFEFANAWGNNFALLLVWFVVGFWVYGTPRQRRWVPWIIGLSAIPLLYSLNRGAWGGLILVGLYLAVRLALLGRWRTVAIAAAAAVVAGAVFLVSPAASTVQLRLDSPHSNSVRSSLAAQSVDLAASSPVIGYGSTRNTIGSERSVTIGPTVDCPRCGERVVGSTGQFWLLLVAQGFLGALLYIGFFVFSLWRYRRDSSPIGLAGSSVIILTLYFMFFYTAVGMPLAIAMLSVGMLWRNAADSPGRAGLALR